MTTYTKETALYDTGAIADDIEEAGTTASKYITSVGNDGIKIHPYNETTQTADQYNYSKIDSNGMEVWKNDDGESVKIAEFGERSQIGKDNSNRVVINADEFTAYNADSVPFFNVDYDGGQISIVNTNYVSGVSGPYTNKVLSRNTTKTYLFKCDCYYPGYPSNTLDFYIVNCPLTINYISGSDIYISNSTTENGLKFSRYDVTSNKKQVRLSITQASPFPNITFGTAFTEEKSITATVKKISDNSTVGTITFYIEVSYNPSQKSINATLKYSSSDWGSSSNSVYITGGGSSILLKYTYSTTTITNAPALTFGHRALNGVTGGFSSILGEGLLAEYEAQTVIGKYNNNQQNSLFEVGNGTADDARSNALTVDWDGRLRINNVQPIYNTNTYIQIRHSSIDSDGTPPTSSEGTIYSGALYNFDTDGARIGHFENYYDTSGGIGMTIGSSRVINGSPKYNNITSIIKADGTYAYSVSSAAAFRSAIGLNLTWETKSLLNQTISATSNKTINIPISVSGKTPIAIRGWNFNNSSSGGANCSVCVPYSCLINGTNVTFEIRNNASSQAKIDVYVYVLYMGS